MYFIRDFGRVTEFADLRSLRKALQKEFKGRHVSLQWRGGAYGMWRTIYVSVDARGKVFHTYGEQVKVDFRAVQAEAEASVRLRHQAAFAA